MTTSNLDRILEEVKALTPDEQRSLRDLVDELLFNALLPGADAIAGNGPALTEEEFEQHLLRKGIISRVPPRTRDATFYANRRAVKVEGKPVSEIIIKERR